MTIEDQLLTSNKKFLLILGILILFKFNKKNEADTVMQFESIGYKPQTIKVSKKSEKIMVKQYFLDAIGSNFGSNLFITEVIKPLKIDEMYDLTLGSLSGGQLQLLYLAICLGHRDNPTFYLIDEPSAYLDIEKRLIAAKAIKRY